MGIVGVNTPGPKPIVKIASTLFAIALLVLLVPFCHGQTVPVAPQAPAAQTAPAPSAAAAVLTTSADEVSLDLSVHDKKNKIVLDLKPGDLTVTDNDAPVTLNNLHLVTGGSASGHMVTLVFDQLEGPVAKNARDIANKILKMAPRNGFSFAVMTVGSRLRLVQGFTADRQALGHAIDIATGEGEVQQGIAIAAVEKALLAEAQTGVDSSGKLVSVGDRSMAQMLAAAIEGSQRIVQDQHTRPALAGLLALARSQQQLLERKSIIYFTLGAQMDTTARDMMRTIVGAANRSGVSVYTVDMNGLGNETRNQLMTMSAIGSYNHINPVTNPGRGQPGDPAGAGAATMVARTMDRFEGKGIDAENNSPIALLASGTGGAYIDGQDNVKKPLERMFQDMTTYYEATYVPPIVDYDGKFRSIAVKPVRAGLTVRSKTGYFALPPGSGEGIRPFEAPLLKILSGTDLPTNLKFHAGILRLGDLPDGNTNTLVVEVPVSELEIKKDSHTNLFAARVSIVAQVKDLHGTVVEHFSEDIPRRGALESIDKAKAEVITLQRHFIAPPGEYILEAAILDHFSQEAAAVRGNFEIPQMPAGPSLSDLALVRRMNNVSEDSDSLEPMRYENARITPNISGEVPAGEKAVSVFFVVHPDPRATDPPALNLEVVRNGKPAGHMQLPVQKGSGSASFPYLATFQTSSFASGDYDVKTTITQGGKAMESDISFTVAGGQPAAGATGAAADANTQPAADANLGGALVISVPTNPVPAPSPEELKSIIEDARTRAVGYAQGLPNFMCVEVTNRSTDVTGTGRWKHQDTVVEMLTYLNKSETRTMLQVNGLPINGGRESMKGTFSSGEFGGVLNAVFQASSKADFQWKETDVLGGGTVQVFSYRVAKENASFTVTGNNKTTGENGVQITVGFHGQVFIDSATRSVRRITLEADDLPRDFNVHSTAVAVDYDYVVINSHDYLMPVSAVTNLKQGRHEAVLNEMEFKDYRRFGSNVKILGFTPVEK
jgi:VWFA-related protein